MALTGAAALLKLLADFGVRHLFGNPGTTELPLNDALCDEPRIRYILGLQEIPVLAMADGYAMASGQLGVVNLHVCCGLGNAMGMLYNAYREGTPLLVTAGQQDRRLRLSEPILWGRMVDVARPWTKSAAEVESVADLPAAARRAVQTALTPPTGPVFLSLPLDVQMESAEGLDLAPPKLVDPRVRPPQSAVEAAARLLAAARNPAVLAGSRITETGAVAELVAVAERLGAPVFCEPNHTHGRPCFPPCHPLYAQVVPHWSPEIRQTLAEFDVLLVAGMDLVRLYIHFEPSRPIPEHLKIIHFDEDPAQIGKNLPVDVGVLGHTQPGLAELDGRLAALMSAADQSAARLRGQQRAARHQAARAALQARIDAERAERPMTPRVFMESIARVLPEDVAVVEEAVTTTNTVLERLGALRSTDGLFGHRGWALGWGLGCAIGVKLAWPERPVMAILGEGAALYGIQGLWSAAHDRVPVTFVISNNSQYQILKAGARALGLPAAQVGRFVGMDLAEPRVDLVGLARSLGVAAQRVSEPDELSELLAQSLAGDAPRLLDVTIRPALDGPGV